MKVYTVIHWYLNEVLFCLLITCWLSLIFMLCFKFFLACAYWLCVLGYWNMFLYDFLISWWYDIFFVKNCSVDDCASFKYSWNCWISFSSLLVVIIVCCWIFLVFLVFLPSLIFLKAFRQSYALFMKQRCKGSFFRLNISSRQVNLNTVWMEKHFDLIIYEVLLKDLVGFNVARDRMLYFKKSVNKRTRLLHWDLAEVRTLVHLSLRRE